MLIPLEILYRTSGAVTPLNISLIGEIRPLPSGHHQEALHIPGPLLEFTT